MRAQLHILLAVFFAGCLLCMFPKTVSAQSCTGSVTCKEQITSYECDGGRDDGDDCSSGECEGGTCKLVQDYNYNTESCDGYPQYCSNGCYSGWTFHSGGCTPVSTPPPPPPTYPPVTRYGCSGSSCVIQSGGPYTTANCNGACTTGAPPPTAPPSQKYSCSGGACIVDPAGLYTDPSCAGACAPPPTAPPPVTCEPEHKYKTATIWVRFLSQGSSGETIAWKGSEANNPIFTNAGWSVEPPATDAHGNKYFRQFRAYSQGDIKTFDMSRNFISQAMNVELGVANPGAHDTIEDKCNTERTVDLPNSLPHGENWSNHFCSGGLAFQTLNSLYPSKTNPYCQNDIGGPVYWKEDTSGELGTLDCDGTPRVWAAKDRDGCEGGFMQYGGGVIGGEGVYGSMHDQLVPILEFADPIHWADLSYDEYWSMQFQAWDEYDSFDGVHTSIVVTPPSGQLCKEVRWFSRLKSDIKEEYPGVQTLVNGKCSIDFNPKSDGNVLIVEYTPPVVQEQCTVELSTQSEPTNWQKSLTVQSGEPVNVKVTGQTNEVYTPSTQSFNLWMANKSSTPYPTISVQPFDAVASPAPYSVAGNMFYQYAPTSPCAANASGGCTISTVINYESATSGIAKLPSGTYSLHCDNLTGVNKCSGNSLCSWNGGSLNCSVPDCLPDATSTPTDHATLTVQCVSNCDTCSVGTEEDVCNPGNYCSPGTFAQTPVAPTSITAPASSQAVTSGTFPVSWTHPGTITVDYDHFEYIIYKQGAYAGATIQEQSTAAWNDRANAASAGGPGTKVLSYTAITSKSNTPAAPTNASLGRDLVFAVRAVNSPSGTNSCSGNPVLYSPWTVKNFTLTSSVSGLIYDDPDDDGAPNSSVPANFPGATISLSDGYSTILPAGVTSFIIPAVPYQPSAWGIPLLRSISINVPGDAANTYVCSTAPGQSITGLYSCQVSNTYSPQSDAHFYVKNINLAYDSWWQIWGGLLYARESVDSAIPANASSPCGISANCYQHLVAANYGQASPGDDSAGIPVSGSTIETGAESRFSQIPSNPAAENSENNIIENYTYFIRGTDLDIPTNPTGSVIKTAATVLSEADASTTEADGTVILQYHGDLTLNLNTTKLSVNFGEKYIIFVAGSLLVQGPISGHNDTTQRELINVAEGGFLAFIANGDITFDSAIGYDDNDGDYQNDSLASIRTPNVEGVFIASDTLTVASTRVGDYKFIGAGTFVGWNDVKLPREYDSSDPERRQLNNTSPTELFIYRPDFVINAPEFMMRSQLTWQEVP